HSHAGLSRGRVTFRKAAARKALRCGGSQSSGSERITKIPNIWAEANETHASPIAPAARFSGESVEGSLAEQTADPVRSDGGDFRRKETENGHPSTLCVPNGLIETGRLRRIGLLETAGRVQTVGDQQHDPSTLGLRIKALQPLAQSLEWAVGPCPSSP